MNLAFFVVADECNLKCVHCVWEATFNPNPSMMTLENIRGVLPALKRAGYEEVSLTGGEPLLEPFSVKVLDEAAQMGFHTGMCTNGILITPEIAKDLKDADIQYLAISLNSLEAKTNNKMRGGFKQVLQAIDYVQEAGIEGLNVSVTVGKPNIHEIPAMAQFALERGFRIGFSPLWVPEGAPDFEELSLLALPLERRLEIYSEIEESCRATNNLSFLRFFKAIYCSQPPEKPRQCFGCNNREHNAVIDHNGDVFPCFHRKDLLAGNVFTEDPDLVLQQLEVVRQELKGAPCFGVHCVGLHV